MSDVALPQRDRNVISPAAPATVIARGIQTIINVTAGSQAPAVFISARVCKLSGDGDDTDIILKLDGRVIVQENYKNLLELGLNQPDNNYGIAVLENGTSGVKTITIGFSSPLSFKSTLQIEVNIKEENVSKIESTVLWGGDKIMIMGPGSDPPKFP
jgi:hypothetical protein